MGVQDKDPEQKKKKEVSTYIQKGPYSKAAAAQEAAVGSAASRGGSPRRNSTRGGELEAYPTCGWLRRGWQNLSRFDTPRFDENRQATDVSSSQ